MHNPSPCSRRHPVQVLHDAQKSVYVDTNSRTAIHPQRLLNKLKHPEIPDMLWFSSDEKNFDQDKKINRRNDRWLCADPSDVPHVMHTKFSATVMVLGVVNNEGHIMPPLLFSLRTS